MVVHLGKPKTWVFITLCSLFVYTLHWLPITIRYVWSVYSRPGGPVDPYFYRISSLLGVMLRFLGVSLALLSIYLSWRHKANPLPYVKGTVSAALFLEGLYFISFVPSVFRLIDYGQGFLAATYFLQILLISPFLIALGFKVKLCEGNTIETRLPKWIGMACVGYIAALWVNNVFRWLDMVWRFSIRFLSAGIAFLGFLNAISTLSLAVSFAVVGLLTLLKKRNGDLSTKWFGLSLTFLGAHFLIYLLYSAYVDALNFALLVEVWAVPLLGLGLSLLRRKAPAHFDIAG